MGKSRKPRHQEVPDGLPRDYLESMADRIHRSNPSKQIILNTVIDIWMHGHQRGYDKKASEIKKFKQKRHESFERDWKEFATFVDDTINDKSGDRPNFTKWQKNYDLHKGALASEQTIINENQEVNE